MIWHGTVSNYVGNFLVEHNCFRFIYQTRFVITFIRTLMMKCICELYVMWHVCWILYDLGCCKSFIETRRGTRWTTGLYGFKYNSATACGLPLYLYSYKLVGSATIHKGSRNLTLPYATNVFLFGVWCQRGRIWRTKGKYLVTSSNGPRKGGKWIMD